MQHAWMGQKNDPCKIKVRKIRTLARPRQRWENCINIYQQETKWDGVDFSHLVQDKEQWWNFVKTVINLQFP